MTDKLNEAKKDVDDTYNLMIEAVRNTTAEYTVELDSIVHELSKGINLFSNAELWDFQVRLSLAAYALGNIKEQGLLREACSEALYKLKLAQEYTATTGTQEYKKQTSIINAEDKQAISIIYASAASLLKTKCDEAHRLVNVLQGIQISRASEAKSAASPRSELDRVSFGE